MERYDYFKIKYKTDMFHHDYLNLLDFSEGVARVSKSKLGISYMDKSGKLIMPYNNNIFAAGSFKNGVAVRTLHGNPSDSLLEIIDMSGEVIFSDVVNCVPSCNDDFIITRKGPGWGYWGCMDREGNQIIPFIYESLNPFYDGLFCAKKDGKWGYLDIKGNVAIPFIYDIATDFSEGFAIVEQNDERFYIDKKGKQVLLFPYEVAWPVWFVFKNGVAIVEDPCTHKYGGIKLGEKIIPFIFESSNDICSYDEGFSVKKDGKWGWLNKDGCEVIPCIYDSPLEFGDGLFVTSKKENEEEKKYGYINMNGKVVIPFMYRVAEPFKDGFAIVVNENGVGFINKNNEPFIIEDEAYVSSSADVPEGAFDIKIEEYLSAFLIDGKTVFIRDTDYQRYQQKLKEFLTILQRDQEDNLGMIYQEIFDKNQQAKKA